MTNYLIWRDGGDENHPNRQTAVCPRDAAVCQAEHDHAARDGWEWSWPVAYVVEDIATGNRWRVEVDREVVPHFSAGRAVEVAR